MRMIQLVYEGVPGGVLRVALEYNKNLGLLDNNNIGIVVTSMRFSRAKGFYGFEPYFKLDFRIPKALRPYVSGLLNQIASMHDIKQVLYLATHKDLKFDWILVHNLTPIEDAFYLAKKLKARIAVLIHNPTYPPSIANYVIMTLFGRPLRSSHAKSIKLLKEADIVLTIHKYNIELVKQLYDIEAISIPLGCNPSPWIPPRRGSYILVPVRMSLGKKVHRLAEAISLADKDAKVIFAGAKHYTTHKVVKLIKKSWLRNFDIVFNVPKNIFEKLFLGARAVVYGLSETDFLMPASYGAPVVCGKKKYAGDVLVDGAHGYLIDYDSEIPIEKYAKAISKLLDSERLAWGMGRKAWEIAKKHVFIIDMHTAGKCIPFILLDPAPPELRRKIEEVAYASGITVLDEFPPEKYERIGLAKSLPAVAVKEGIPSFTVELPGFRGIDLIGAKAGFIALKNMLVKLGVIEDKIEAIDFVPIIKEKGYRRETVYAEKPGLIEYVKELGEKVAKGEILAKVRSIFGEVIEEVKAPWDGYIISVNPTSTVGTGSYVASMAIKMA